jgi:hypothetical protein
MLILMSKVLLDPFVKVVWSTLIFLTVRGACISPPESGLRVTLFPTPRSTVQFVLIVANGKQLTKSQRESVSCGEERISCASGHTAITVR